MHIMLFVLIMIITVSVIFIPIIHKSTVDDIAAIEAMDSNGDTVEPGLNVAPVSYTHLDVYKRQDFRSDTEKEE